LLYLFFLEKFQSESKRKRQARDEMVGDSGPGADTVRQTALNARLPVRGIYGTNILSATDASDVLSQLKSRVTGIHVLDDCGIEIAGLKFYGSPWTPRFGDWAWMAEDEELAATFASIPVGLDVLITHGPPYGILDEVSRGENVGSCSLLEEVKRKKPRFHVFGHIHEARGYRHCEHTDFHNVASLDENYEELGEPMIIEAFV
jgi:Icc-related predicted phosphoesterase